MTRRILRHQESYRLDLGESDWVDLKPRWTVFDRQKINDAMITLRLDSSQVVRAARKKTRDGFRPGHDPKEQSQDAPVVKLEQSMNLYAANVAALKCAIQAWGGPGFCVRDHGDSGEGHRDGANDVGCGPIPLTDEAIMEMDDETSSIIVKTLEELNPQVPAEEGGDEEHDAPLSIGVGSN